MRKQLKERADTVMRVLNEEKISTSNDERNFRLSVARELTMQKAAGFTAPGLTSCVATTLLKVGLCQELSQRFVLEYCVKYREQNISLIILNKPGFRKKEDHILVYIGPINVPDQLIIGRGSSDVRIKPEEHNLKIEDFLSKNQDGVLADPLLNCAGNTSTELSSLIEYCEKYDITHVVGVRSFINTPNLTQNAPPIIKENAIKIAEEISIILKSMGLQSQTQATENSSTPKNASVSYKKIEYKEESSDYVRRLKFVLGTDIVRTSTTCKQTIFFPISWLKQLGDKAVQELSDELKVDKNELTF